MRNKEIVKLKRDFSEDISSNHVPVAKNAQILSMSIQTDYSRLNNTLNNNANNIISNSNNSQNGTPIMSQTENHLSKLPEMKRKLQYLRSQKN
jgi:hypothetical protein